MPLNGIISFLFLSSYSSGEHCLSFLFLSLVSCFFNSSYFSVFISLKRAIQFIRQQLFHIPLNEEALQKVTILSIMLSFSKSRLIAASSSYRTQETTLKKLHQSCHNFLQAVLSVPTTMSSDGIENI